MKQLTEKVTAPSQNAWGGIHNVTRQRFEIEQSDVGEVRPHYLGYNHRDYKFWNSDVGRTIEVLTNGHGWTCWSFVSNPQG